jgi:two-component system sensor histidine kinase KdpD
MEYLAATALVTLATAVGMLVREHVAGPDLVMLYLLAIGVVAARLGRGPSLLASALAVLGYDFFFVQPYYTFAVHDQRHLFSFAMMFVVAVVTSGITLRLRHQGALALERARLAEEARVAALRLKTEELRSSLLSAVSHDLRTPLAAITGAATTLRDATAELRPAQRADLLETICEEAERLERLVRNLLDMTQLQSGTLEVKREWVPLDEIVGSALTRLDAQLAGRAVLADLPADLPLVSVDPVLLEQVFVNLLENARKYTPADSSVEIRARVEDGGVAVEVADRGPGLPPGSEGRLFEKFYRGSRTGAPGAGLGLAICRGIAQAHGGTLVAEDRAGGGAVFRLTLPPTGTVPSVPVEPDAGGAHAQALS